MVEPAQETGVNCRECWARREWYREYIGERFTEGYLKWLLARANTVLGAAQLKTKNILHG